MGAAPPEAVVAQVGEVAASQRRDWTAVEFPLLKRLVALGDRPGPGWWTWADLQLRGLATAADLAARARAVRSTDIHNIQFTNHAHARVQKDVAVHEPYTWVVGLKANDSIALASQHGSITTCWAVEVE